MSSSGKTRKIADLMLQKVSASMSVSKHKTCSSSESMNAFSRAKAVDKMDCIAWPEVFKEAPANHRALWFSGSRSISSLNSFDVLAVGAIKSWISLKTETICRLCGSAYSAINKIVAVNKPSAES